MSKLLSDAMKEMLSDFKSGVQDYTVNGKCIECGSCCSRYLPMTMDEIKQVRTYIKKHNIKRQMHGANVLSMPQLDYLCPFLDDTKEKHKCTIYEARPMICKRFICNRWEEKRNPDKKRGLLPVDVTETFFPKTETPWDKERIAFYK